MSQDNRLLPISPLDHSLDRPLSDLTQSKPYGVAGVEATTLRDYLFVVLKRKWLILSLVLAVTSLVTIQMFRSPSIYKGETTIKIEPKPRSVLQTKDIVINAQSDPNFWGTQLRLLENPTLARQVVLTLDLQNNPAFLGGQSQGGIERHWALGYSSTKPFPYQLAQPSHSLRRDLRGSQLPGVALLADECSGAHYRLGGQVVPDRCAQGWRCV